MTWSAIRETLLIRSSEETLNAMKTCDCPFSRFGSAVIWWVAFPPESIAARRSSINARPEPFQKPIGSGRFDASMSPRNSSEPALLIKPTLDRQQFTARPIGCQSAVGELRHRHVEDNVSLRRGNRDHQRIVAHSRIRSAPGRKIGQRVGPADSNDAGVSGLPAVTSATHPVIGIRQRHAAHSMFTG